MSYRKRADVLPPAIKVLDGSVKKLPQCDIDITYALTTGLIYELVDLNRKAIAAQARGDNVLMNLFMEYTDNYFRFMMDNFEDEMTVMGAKSILGKPHSLKMNAQKLKTWKEFTHKFIDIIPAG
jgi:hypothetical protein